MSVLHGTFKLKQKSTCSVFVSNRYVSEMQEILEKARIRFMHSTGHALNFPANYHLKCRSKRSPSPFRVGQIVPIQLLYFSAHSSGWHLLQKRIFVVLIA